MLRPPFRRMLSSFPPPLTTESINQSVVSAEYAVRGELVLRAMAHEASLKAGNPDALPFEKLVYCNIGNPQALAQAALSFPRQVLAMCDCPSLLDAGIFPADAVARARTYLDAVPAGTGAYTESQGIAIVRDEVAAFLEARDGYAADPGEIFVTDGASPAVQRLLQLVIAAPDVGIMIPTPQYPLYSAAICLLGGRQVGYLLDESNEWDMDVAELRRSLDAARAEGTNVKALAVINPGNPTGQCLGDETMRAVVELCAEEGMVLLADEVYQENLWRRSDRPWASFKKVVCDMAAEGSDAAQHVQLASFHSVSKGFVGECGRRGGFVELHNIDADVKAELYKLCSVSLCSNVPGQLMVGLMVNPPAEGDESYPTYIEERDSTLQSLERRATKLASALDSLDGVACSPTHGSMYVFPSVALPTAAVDAAAKAGKAADAFYCLAMLDETGIVVVPGSGFGQKEGTFHFRATILPPEDDMDRVIVAMTKFHASFVERYAA